MHLESRTYMAQAFRTHAATIGAGTVLDVGAGGTSGVYRQIWEGAGWQYFGVDLGPGPDVDLILHDPQIFPFADGSFDAVISGQMLEHNPMFWLTFLEMTRILRPGGLMVHIAPSRGREHRAPSDCWRFYRDGMAALAAWSGLELVEATTDWRSQHIAHYAKCRPKRAAEMRQNARQVDTEWGDTVGIFRKPQQAVVSDADRYLAHFARQRGKASITDERAQNLTQDILNAFELG